MKQHKNQRVCILLGAVLLIGVTQSESQAQQTTALVGAKVIDGTGSPRSSQPWTVVIQDERIIAAGPKVKVPKGATVVDVAGKTLLPGLIDMHAHFYARVNGKIKNVFEPYRLLYLAGGITSARSPGDLDPDGMYDLKQKIARGELEGPRIFMGGYYIDHSPSRIGWFKPINTPQEAVERIEQWKDKIDVVKFYTSITDAEIEAGIATAKRLGIPTSGHLGSVTAGRAIDLGIDALEHGIYAMSELGAPGPKKTEGCPLGELDVEGAQVDALVDKIVSHRVAIDPTFVVLTFAMPDMEAFTPDWRDYFIDAAAADSVDKMVVSSREELKDPQKLSCEMRTRENAFKFVKKVHDRGGVILTGTDPVLAYIMPGWGLHREMRILTQAGLTPLEAIRAATYDAAVVLRREKDFGSIAAGKLADIVVVSGDPSKRIEDIGNTEIIFKAGRRFDPKALRAAAKGTLQ